MEGENDILELRFTGNNVNPGIVKPREIAGLIVGFEKALLSEIKERHPQYDIEQLFFSFEQIKNESLGLSFLPKMVNQIVVSSYLAISGSFNTGDFSELSNNTIKELKTLTGFSKKYNCTGNFNLNDQTISSFTPQTDIPFNKNQIIKGDINLFGKVMDSGGDNPNVHLKLSDEKTLIFSTSEEYAKQLAHKLYEKVSLIGSAKWDGITYEIIDFKLKEIVEFTAGNTLNAINELRNLTSGFWDKFNTNDDINNQLLRD
jgi:hypothetical protein